MISRPTVKVMNKDSTFISVHEVKKAKVVKKKTSSKIKKSKKDFHSFSDDGSMIIKNIMNDGEYLTFHGDLILGTTDEQDDLIKNNKIVIRKPIPWPGGIIFYSIDEGLPNRDEILNSINYLESKTRIRFRKKTNESDYVRFTKSKVNCYASLGKTGGEQRIALSPLCKKREILHEVLHTLGFVHEHSRSDRDEYIDVLWKNISEDHYAQFKKIEADFNIVKNRPFDYDSIMIYPSTFFSLYPGEYSLLKLNSDVIKANFELLSPEDISRINLLYP